MNITHNDFNKISQSQAGETVRKGVIKLQPTTFSRGKGCYFYLNRFNGFKYLAIYFNLNYF